MDGRVVDLAVIGSGGAGFAAAIRASVLGRSVVMIERGRVGGTCVNTGCVPSKALIAAAQARQTAADAARFPGITASPGPVNMAAVMAGKDDLVGSMRSEKYLEVADGYGWPIMRGDAHFAGGSSTPVLRVTGADGSVQTVAAEHYLVATGSRPWIPPIPGLDRADPLTSTTAMELREVPGSLVIVGGGYVALEQAQLFARLGSKVSVLARSRLTSREEPEAAAALSEVFADQGIRVIERARVDAVAGSSPGVVVTATTRHGAQRIAADRVLVATGRRPVTAGLGLGTVGVRTGVLGEVLVSDRLVSSNPRVWAAGDVTGHPEFVYVAAAHGSLVVDNAFSGAGRAVDYRQLPRVTFTSPALGAVGLTEEQAVASGVRCDCRVLPLRYVPRALVNRDVRGLIKVVADADSGRILGLTAVAEDAGELAAAGGYLLAGGLTVDEVAHGWSPYLTMAEGIRIACQSFTTDVERLSCCAA